VAKSFADIYRENCLQNGLLPMVLAPADADAFIARGGGERGWTIHATS
jgi:3-isopropylmalate dehydratase small subunit